MQSLTVYRTEKCKQQIKLLQKINNKTIKCQMQQSGVTFSRYLGLFRTFPMFLPIFSQCFQFISPETSKNYRFSDVFREHKMGALGRQGLKLANQFNVLSVSSVSNKILCKNVLRTFYRKKCRLIINSGRINTNAKQVKPGFTFITLNTVRNFSLYFVKFYKIHHHIKLCHHFLRILYRWNTNVEYISFTNKTQYRSRSKTGKL